MANSRPWVGRAQGRLGKSCTTKAVFQDNKGMSTGHKGQYEGALTSHMWGNLSVKKNNN